MTFLLFVYLINVTLYYAGLEVSEPEVIVVIRSFSACSASGSQGICPKKIFDLTKNKEIDPALAASLINFVDMVLTAQSHERVIPVSFDGSHIAFEKKSGGV